MGFETETANTERIEDVIREVKLYNSRAFNFMPNYNNTDATMVLERTPRSHEWMYWREGPSVYMAKRWDDLQGLGVMAKSFKELVWRVAYAQILVEKGE